VANGPLPGPLPLFPASNWWNLDISSAPIDPASASYIAFINNVGTRRLHPDFGGYASPGGPDLYGFPFIVVDGNTPKKAVDFYYRDESDGVDHSTGLSFPFYPIPDEAIGQAGWIEGGWPGNVDQRNSQDRHMLIVDRDNRHLYELYNVYYDGSGWLAGSGAFFDLNANGRRPDGWTSADAAGLAILPGLVRHDEVFGPDEIRHAFRVTVRATNGYVYPASHRAGTRSGALPMGARLRLKSSKSLAGFRPEIAKIFRAMQRYGLIVADNGSDMYVSGAFDPRWNNDVLNPAFRALTASDFEVIELGYKESAPPTAPPSPTPSTPPAPPAPIPPPSTPNAPLNLSSEVSGSVVTLRWGPPSGASPDGYEIEVGSAPGQSDLGRLARPATEQSYVATQAQAGTYFIRVRARSAGILGAASNEIRVEVGSCVLPGPASGLGVQIDGSLVHLRWTAPSTGSAPIGYVIQAGSAAGTSNLAVLDTGTNATAFDGVAPPGQYYVRIRARNTCGAGPASNEVAFGMAGSGLAAGQRFGAMIARP
jgi:hypothetical protein